jgi:hypothetical protein
MLSERLRVLSIKTTFVKILQEKISSPFKSSEQRRQRNYQELPICTSSLTKSLDYHEQHNVVLDYAF